MAWRQGNGGCEGDQGKGTRGKNLEEEQELTRGSGCRRMAGTKTLHVPGIARRAKAEEGGTVRSEMGQGFPVVFRFVPFS